MISCYPRYVLASGEHTSRHVPLVNDMPVDACHLALSLRPSYGEDQ